MFEPLQVAYFLVLAGVLGACAASFVNNLAWRMVRGKSALKGRSECSQCGHKLGALDLVPILSWLFLRGKCRYCKARISARYIVVEVITAVVFVLIAWHYGLSIQTLAYFFLASILLGVLLVDIETMTIPNGFIIAGIIVWVASVWFIRPPLVGFGIGSMFVGSFGYGFLAVLIDGLAGAFAIGGGMLVFATLFDKITGRNSLGGGDVKLFFMVGLYLGVAAGFFNLLLSCILGLVFSFVWIASGAAEKQDAALNSDAEGEKAAEAPEADAKNTDSAEQEHTSAAKKAFPFGPAIVVSTILTLLVGFQFVTWYIDLLL
jgi:leader peptidase (prepilin peptidase)/N-methyltransferase